MELAINVNFLFLLLLLLRDCCTNVGGASPYMLSGKMKNQTGVVDGVVNFPYQSNF